MDLQRKEQVEQTYKSMELLKLLINSIKSLGDPKVGNLRLKHYMRTTLTLLLIDFEEVMIRLMFILFDPSQCPEVSKVNI